VRRSGTAKRFAARLPLYLIGHGYDIKKIMDESSHNDRFSQFRVGVIQSIEDLSGGKESGKIFRACIIDVGLDEPITVVTTAPNVREGSR
jgi:tRNA-binding EMAP/Myf-like protein